MVVTMAAKMALKKVPRKDFQKDPKTEMMRVCMMVVTMVAMTERKTAQRKDFQKGTKTEMMRVRWMGG
jgi:hypothetical protein